MKRVSKTILVVVLPFLIAGCSNCNVIQHRREIPLDPTSFFAMDIPKSLTYTKDESIWLFGYNIDYPWGGADLYKQKYDSIESTNSTFEDLCENGWEILEVPYWFGYEDTSIDYFDSDGARYCISSVIQPNQRVDFSLGCQADPSFFSYSIIQREEWVFAFYERTSNISLSGETTNNKLLDLSEELGIWYGIKDEKERVIWEIKNWGLFGRDMSGVDLSGLDLSGFDFSNINLVGANLSSAYLYRVDFTRANLNGADLSNSDLGLANLTDAKLKGTDLSNADLRATELNGAHLDGADLRGADLSGADLSDSTITQTQISQAASIEGAILP